MNYLIVYIVFVNKCILVMSILYQIIEYELESEQPNISKKTKSMYEMSSDQK